MTDAQARRIETLLRLQAYQLHTLLTAMVAMVAPEDVVREPGFKATSQRAIAESKQVLIGMLTSLNEEIRAEGGSEPDDLATKTQELNGRRVKV